MDKIIKLNEKFKSLEEFFAELETLVVKIRHFQSGRIDHYGNVVGVKEYPSGQYPFVHQDHFYDELDRVIKLEKYDNDFSRPIKRIYFYNPKELKVIESVWFDRYDRIDNIHRYLYDGVSGLMIQRAEYTKEGEIFYTITSKYDQAEPPHLIEEMWNDVRGKMIKRQEYSYNENDEMSEERFFNSKNELTGFNQFFYDENGNLLERRWHNSNGVVMSSFVYTYYDTNDVFSLCIYNAVGNLETWQEFYRDAYGNTVEERWYDKEHRLIRQIKHQ